MVFFSLCCEFVQNCFRALEEDIMKISSRTAFFTIRRLRRDHVDMVDRVRDVSDIFGLRLLLYVLMLQLILLEKADFLVNKISSHRSRDYVAELRADPRYAAGSRFSFAPVSEANLPRNAVGDESYLTGRQQYVKEENKLSDWIPVIRGSHKALYLGLS
ncbi:hypothetical protein J6590_007200 [Homalodisca vitripennis]|nr:hypothetical protein J6590_007200 [Homalodisca vitripennis]